MFAAINAFLTRAISGYFLNKSLRFRGSASAYLNRTASASISTFTVSMWVKRGTLTSNFQYFFSYNNSGNTDGYGLAFNQTTDTLYYYNGTAQATTAAYRDPAAWYHIVFSNNAGAFTLYVNGVSVKTGTATAIPSSSVMNLGRYGFSSTFYFDGELAEVNFVDGQALAPTAFGAFSTYNQWLPKKYAGTYGTNGFYLPFNATSATSYAGSFNGTSQYLTLPNNTAMNFGSGDFTVECWIKKTSSNAAGYDTVVEVGTGGSGFQGFTMEASSSRGYAWYTQPNPPFVLLNYTTSPDDGQWHHFAVSRTGSTTTMFVDGISRATYSGSYTIPSTATIVSIGAESSAPTAFFKGSISNLRLVKGTGLYTANFIPPTAALTAVTGTGLLTLQNATIVDNSTNAFTITNVGTVVTSVQSPFLNTTVLAADSSGNANNWTPNNISLTAGSTYDSLTDVPTLTSATAANYAVLNPLQNGGGTLSGGNLNLLGASAAWGTRLGTIAVTSGKWYFEVTPTSGSATAGIHFGITQNAAPAGFLGQDANGYSYYGFNGQKYNNNAGVAYGATVADNDVVGVAFDVTAGTLTFYKNNVSQGVAFSSLAAGTWFLGVSCYNTATASINFGQQPFTYTPPTGFLPLNTYNIAAGTVTTSGTFTGNASTDGPMVYLNGTPTALTINGNAVTFGTQADKLANGFKVRSSSASYNAAGSNTYTASTVGAVFKYEDAQSNP